MEQVLIAREVIVKFVKRFEIFILPVAKFLLGLFIFSRIHGIDQVHSAVAPFADAVSPAMLTWLFALLFTVMPMNLSWVLIILNITLQFSANIEVAVAVFLFLMFIFLFYARMATRESMLILFTLIAFHYNVPYLVPLIVGLYFPVTAIIPVTIGVFIDAQIPLLFGLTAPSPVLAGELDFAEIITELPAAFSEVYTALMSTLGATQTWIFTAVILATVIILVHIVSRLSVDFSKEIAIVLGCIMIIFGTIMSVLMLDENANIPFVIISALICGLLAWIVRFFDSVLDYQRAENVQFEDDNNYYHVRIVPKVIMTKPKRVVRRIRPQPEESEDDS